MIGVCRRTQPCGWRDCRGVSPAGHRVGACGGELFDATRLAAAEWYPDGQHVGVAAALIARAAERRLSLAPMEVARVTVDLNRVVPVTRLEVVVETVREGKRHPDV